MQSILSKKRKTKQRKTLLKTKHGKFFDFLRFPAKTWFLFFRERLYSNFSTLFIWFWKNEMFETSPFELFFCWILCINGHISFSFRCFFLGKLWNSKKKEFHLWKNVSLWEYFETWKNLQFFEKRIFKKICWNINKKKNSKFYPPKTKTFSFLFHSCSVLKTSKNFIKPRTFKKFDWQTDHEIWKKKKKLFLFCCFSILKNNKIKYIKSLKNFFKFHVQFSQFFGSEELCFLKRMKRKKNVVVSKTNLYVQKE